MGARDPRWPLAAVVAAVAVAVYAWWAAGLDAFTWPMRFAVAAPALLVLALAWRGRPRRGSGPALAVDGTARAWLVVIAAMALCQLGAYVAGFWRPRSDVPTLSWILDHVDWRPAKAIMFATWLLAGWDLARR